MLSDTTACAPCTRRGVGNGHRSVVTTRPVKIFAHISWSLTLGRVYKMEVLLEGICHRAIMQKKDIIRTHCSVLVMYP